MGELREWTAWYKANRSLLLGGDVVRVDLPEHGAFLRGVVTPDAAVTASASPRPLRSRTAARSSCPASTRTPTTACGHCSFHFAGRPGGVDPTAPGIGRPPWLIAPDGVTMSGKALSTTGIRTPWLVPNHALVLEVTRVP